MNNEQQNMSHFIGGEEVEISKEINGKKTVFVKCLPVRCFAEYASIIDIEVELIALATDLTADQIDSLTPDDSGKIFNKIHELNFEPFTAWLKRKVAANRLKAQAFGIDLPKNTNENNGSLSAEQ